MALRKEHQGMDMHTVYKSVVERNKKIGNTGKELHYLQALGYACTWCFKEIEDPKKCGACRAIYYCSPECAKNSWKLPSRAPLPNTPPQTHKELCPKFKRYMERLPEFKNIIGQFPWGYPAWDGTFPAEIFLASRNLLGSEDFSYWSLSPDPPVPENCVTTKPSTYIYGRMLLHQSFPDEKIAWHNISDDQIPWYDFTSRLAPPRLVAGKILTSWKEWYQWRGLSVDSPVALVMHHVMSCYFMLTNTLGHKPLAPSAPRYRLAVHLVGAEIELNVIPTFAELALLLPGYDITLTLFGPAVHRLTSHAATTGTASLAANATDGPIFTYKTPDSTLSISLHAAGPLWRDQATKTGPWPDVVLALNASLSRYATDWQYPVIECISVGIPFVHTEISEHVLEGSTTPKIKSVYAAILKGWRDGGGLRSFGSALRYAVMEEKAEKPWEIELNPFMRPGLAQGGNTPLPEGVNAFVCAVVTSKEKPVLALK